MADDMSIHADSSHKKRPRAWLPCIPQQAQSKRMGSHGTAITDEDTNRTNAQGTHVGHPWLLQEQLHT